MVAVVRLFEMVPPWAPKLCQEFLKEGDMARISMAGCLLVFLLVPGLSWADCTPKYCKAKIEILYIKSDGIIHVGTSGDETKSEITNKRYSNEMAYYSAQGLRPLP